MQAQFRAHHDDGSARIIYPLAQEVLTKSSAFTLQHIGQGFQWALAGAGNDSASSAVIKERIHRFLKHPLLVANNHLGSV